MTLTTKPTAADEAESVYGQTLFVPFVALVLARIKAGDELDVGYANGMIVMRKRRPLNSSRVRWRGHPLNA